MTVASNRCEGAFKCVISSDCSWLVWAVSRVINEADVALAFEAFHSWVKLAHICLQITLRMLFHLLCCTLYSLYRSATLSTSPWLAKWSAIEQLPLPAARRLMRLSSSCLRLFSLVCAVIMLGCCSAIRNLGILSISCTEILGGGSLAGGCNALCRAVWVWLYYDFTDKLPALALHLSEVLDALVDGILEDCCNVWLAWGFFSWLRMEMLAVDSPTLGARVGMSAVFRVAWSAISSPFLTAW